MDLPELKDLHAPVDAEREAENVSIRVSKVEYKQPSLLVMSVEAWKQIEKSTTAELIETECTFSEIQFSAWLLCRYTEACPCWNEMPIPMSGCWRIHAFKTSYLRPQAATYVEVCHISYGNVL